MEKMNVESFNLDHTKVKAPYVRLAGKKQATMEISFINTMCVLSNPIKNTWKWQVYIH